MSPFYPLIHAADSAAGLCYGDPAKREAYLAWQYPGDTAFAADDMGRGQYGCLLHARACLRACDLDGEADYHGKRIDLLRCAYFPLIGQIEGMLETLARARGWYSTTDLHDIRPADILLVGYGGQAPKDPAERARWKATWGGVTHGMVATAIDDNFLLSVDGGQLDEDNPPHGSAIAQCESRVEMRGTQVWIDGRRLRCRIRV